MLTSSLCCRHSNKEEKERKTQQLHGKLFWKVTCSWCYCQFIEWKIHVPLSYFRSTLIVIMSHNLFTTIFSVPNNYKIIKSFEREKNMQKLTWNKTQLLMSTYFLLFPHDVCGVFLDKNPKVEYPSFWTNLLNYLWFALLQP